MSLGTWLSMVGRQQQSLNVTHFSPGICACLGVVFFPCSCTSGYGDRVERCMCCRCVCCNILLFRHYCQSGCSSRAGITHHCAAATLCPGRKVRFDGNSEELIELAKKNAMALGAGHTFIVFLDGGFPVNCLNAVKNGTEVCRIHCATSNPTSVVLAKTSDDAVGIMGVIDGVRPTDFETDDDKKKRHEFLRMIGYKR